MPLLLFQILNKVNLAKILEKFENAYHSVPSDFSKIKPEGMPSDYFLSCPITAFAESNSEYLFTEDNDIILDSSEIEERFKQGNLCGD